jgi:hypothetical protein
MAVGARANAYNFAVTFFAALGSFTYGYNAAIMGSVIGLPAFFKYYNIDYASSEGSSITGAINGVFYGGGAIGCWTMSYLADYFGRRRCLQIICVVLIISAALQAGSVHIAMLLVARFSNGISIGWINSITPTCKPNHVRLIPPRSLDRFPYVRRDINDMLTTSPKTSDQAEIAPAAQRGRLVGSHGFIICVGYVRDLLYQTHRKETDWLKRLLPAGQAMAVILPTIMRYNGDYLWPSKQSHHSYCYRAVPGFQNRLDGLSIRVVTLKVCSANILKSCPS